MPNFSRRVGAVGRIFAGFLLVASSIALRADALPSAFAVQTFTPSGVIYSGPPVVMYALPIVHTGGSTQLPNSGTLGYTVSVEGGSDPSTSVQLSVLGAFGSGVLDQFDLRSSLTYYFEVNGPADQTAVINFAGSGGAYVPGPRVSTFGAESMIALGAQGASSYLVDAISGAGDTSHLAFLPNTASGLSLNTNVDVETNTAYVVTLFSEAYFGTTGSYTQMTAFAVADPTITLVSTDPDLSLEFSPGLIPDTAPVPEPGTLSLMVAGMAAVGMRVRALRQRA